MQETVTLNSEEQRRLLILNQVERGVVSVAEAAELMGVSMRQVYRLRAAYAEEGATALVHGNRGRTPPRIPSLPSCASRCSSWPKPPTPIVTINI